MSLSRMQRLRENFSCQAADFTVEFSCGLSGLVEHGGVQKQRDASDERRIFLANFSALAILHHLRRACRKFRIQIEVVAELATVFSVPFPDAPKRRHQ